jgi:molecular chaperone DnaJ
MRHEQVINSSGRSRAANADRVGAFMNRDTRDYYEVLGVSPDADQHAIKRAFRSRARELHPDVSPDPRADERFSELATAYRVLTNSSAKLLYDRYGYLGRGNGGFEPAQVMGAPTRSAGSQAFDVAELRVHAVEAARGATRTVDVSTVGSCAACGGEGAEPGSEAETCSTCHGEGRLRSVSDTGAGRLLQIDVCPACRGAGSVVREPCPDCGGTGRANRAQTVTVRIPPGAEDRSIIRLRGDETGAGPHGPDVYVRLRVLPDRDSRPARYAAVTAVAIAVALFVVLLVTPEALIAGLERLGPPSR